VEPIPVDVHNIIEEINAGREKAEDKKGRQCPRERPDTEQAMRKHQRGEHKKIFDPLLNAGRFQQRGKQDIPTGGVIG
jgi:hypothetical protein